MNQLTNSFNILVNKVNSFVKQNYSSLVILSGGGSIIYQYKKYFDNYSKLHSNALVYVKMDWISMEPRIVLRDGSLYDSDNLYNKQELQELQESQEYTKSYLKSDFNFNTMVILCVCYLALAFGKKLK